MSRYYPQAPSQHVPIDGHSPSYLPPVPNYFTDGICDSPVDVPEFSPLLHKTLAELNTRADSDVTSEQMLDLESQSSTSSASFYRALSRAHKSMESSQGSSESSQGLLPSPQSHPQPGALHTLDLEPGPIKLSTDTAPPQPPRVSLLLSNGSNGSFSSSHHDQWTEYYMSQNTTSAFPVPPQKRALDHSAEDKEELPRKRRCLRQGARAAAPAGMHNEGEYEYGGESDHEEEGPAQCPVCLKEFSRRSAVTRHRRAISTATGTISPCADMDPSAGPRAVFLCPERPDCTKVGNYGPRRDLIVQHISRNHDLKSTPRRVMMTTTELQQFLAHN